MLRTIAGAGAQLVEQFVDVVVLCVVAESVEAPEGCSPLEGGCQGCSGPAEGQGGVGQPIRTQQLTPVLQ